MGKDPVIELMSRVPFAGREFIRTTYLDGREEAKVGNFKRKIFSMGILAGMVATHAFQAKMGLDATFFHAHAANSTAVYTQARLLGKLAVTRRESIVPQVETVTEILPLAVEECQNGMLSNKMLESPAASDVSNAETYIGVGVTLAAQLAFLATWLPTILK